MTKTVILGGTGLLGYHAAGELAAAGHSVTIVSTGSVDLGEWLPANVAHRSADVFSMSRDELGELMAGHDWLVYALGPDDRITPPRPATVFFNERLAATTATVCQAAKTVGVERIVVYGSYFTFFDRREPDRRLGAHHPYIAARIAQSRSCLALGDDDLDVVVFEIPYVFGTMPIREPLWQEVLVPRLNLMRPWIFFPPGGTAMCSATYVAQATRAALERGVTGPIPLAEQNMSWRELLRLASEELYGSARRVVTIPGWVASLYGIGQQAALWVRGLDSGLNYRRYLIDVQSRHSDIPESEMEQVSTQLALARRPVEQAIRETFARCRALAG